MQFKIVSAQEFHESITRAKKLNIKYGVTLEAHNIQTYRDCTCFLAYYGGFPCGYAIRNVKAGHKINSELISVFKHPFIKTRLGVDIVNHAVNNGANQLNCFEPIRYIYEMFGFITVQTHSFDASLAGPDWNYEILGRPNVYTMYKPSKFNK